jgi:hypothetical protein
VPNSAQKARRSGGSGIPAKLELWEGGTDGAFRKPASSDPDNILGIRPDFAAILSLSQPLPVQFTQQGPKLVGVAIGAE